MKIIILSSINKRKASQAEPIIRTTTNNIGLLEIHPAVAVQCTMYNVHVGKLDKNCPNKIFNIWIWDSKILVSWVS